MASSSLPVLVAGAGPSGLVAALTLLKNGIPVRIIDKEPQPHIGSRGPGIFPRTFEVFHLLDVPQIHEEADPMLLIRIYEPGTMKEIKSFYMSPYIEPTPAIPYYNPKLIGQQKLEGILRTHLEKYNCHVEFGTELLSLEQNEDRVFAHIIKKENGKEVPETIEASFLIGTDGAKGVTRKQLGLTFLGETREDFRLLLGDMQLESEKLDREHWHFFGQSLVLRPTRDLYNNGFQFIVMAKEGYDMREMMGNIDKLMSFIHEATNLDDIKLVKLNWISEFRPNIRMVDKFGVGRVFVAGDAAHVHSPTGGQGLNSGVQDAFNIAWKVALVHKGLSPLSLLETYSQERMPVIAEMLDLTTELLNKTVRHIGSASMEDAFTRGQKLYMLGVNYRYSPVVLDEFSKTGEVNAYGLLQPGVLIAGDRAPDAPNLVNTEAGEMKLFDVFKPAYHTVLVFGADEGARSAVIDAVSPYDKSVIRTVVVLPTSAAVPAPTTGIDMVLRDLKGHAHEAYLVPQGDNRVVIVRPDDVVGAIVRGAEGVQKYFGNIFTLGTA